MLKKLIVSTLILFPYTSIFAQQKLTSYTQNIEGTKLKFDMQAIPSGTFKMGSENGWAEFHCNAGSVSVWVLKAS
jgi:hypothetical protein